MLVNKLLYQPLTQLPSTPAYFEHQIKTQEVTMFARSTFLGIPLLTFLT